MSRTVVCGDSDAESDLHLYLPNGQPESSSEMQEEHLGESKRARAEILVPGQAGTSDG
jgi:hypothetical protein